MLDGRRIRDCLTSAGSLPLEALARTVQGELLRTSMLAIVAGIDVRLVVPTDRRELVLGRLAEALQLVEAHRPEVMRGMRRVFQHLLIRAGGPAYLHATRTCWLDARMFEPSCAVIVPAATLIHEYVHGRTHRFLNGLTESRRARIEAICMKQQIEFVRGFPEAKWYLDYLDDFQRQQQYDRRGVFEMRARMLRDARLPRWVVRLHSLLFKPRGSQRSSSRTK